MALEVHNGSPESIKDSLSDLKNEVKKENLKKVGRILDQLNASKEDPVVQKEIMKNLIGKVNDFLNVYQKRLVKGINGQPDDAEELALREYKDKKYSDEKISMNKNFSAMTSEDKANVLFAEFGDGLLVRVMQENENQKTTPNEDVMYENIAKQMLDNFVKLKESLNKTE